MEQSELNHNQNQSQHPNEHSNTEHPFHTLTVEQSISQLQTSNEGLSDTEVVTRQERYGKNMLQEAKRKSILARILEQFKDVMIIILLVAAVLAGVLGEIADSIIILFVVVLNAVLGVIQENKAEQALSALKQMSSPSAAVQRQGQVRTVKAEELVPGDIVLLEAGNVVPADMRLIESASLKIEEAALTGESVPVEKQVDPLEKADIVIGDRKNMAYMSSSVTYGRGVGVVTSTGTQTEVGKIASFISQEDTDVTPLQKKLNELGKYFTIIIIAVAILIFIIGWLQGRDLLEMVLTSISLAVAAIPEGLPAIVTIILALGVQRMAKRKAIIRRLPAVETLGSTEIICSDKTGTLTQNKMTVQRIYVDGKVTAAEEVEAARDQLPGYEAFVQVMTLCNDSKVAGEGEHGKGISLIGDPTETALVDFAYNKGFDKREGEQRFPRKAEIPFDSDRKLMTTIHDMSAAHTPFRSMTKGAPDVLLERCTHIFQHGRTEPLSAEHRQQIAAANKEMASKALRVLALAYKDEPSIPADLSPDVVERDLTFIGLVGMIDPPREEVKEAVRICQAAGIRPVMITGDHRDTAAAIAKELNIIQDESGVITGAELNQISDQDFAEKVTQYSVYARVSPEHKVRIVQAWKKRGKVVAMTGDGVNDAPALKASDIGVGMGITGTEVTKGVSDMVLADDNFSTIVIAVEEGRKVYSNIRKTIQFLLSANLGEVVTLFIATLLSWKILSPIHILWINLVTDTLPALALGLEMAEPNIMNQPPRASTSSIFAEGVGTSIIYQGLIEAALTLGTYYWGLTHYTEAVAITMAFATLGLLQLTHAYNVRSNHESLFRIGLFSNKYMNYAAIISGLLVLIVILLPFLNDLFSVTPLTGNQWLIVIGAALSIIPIVEIVKIFIRSSRKSPPAA
ncbi:calcium-translocating P-type ATPase, SERCA-type [Paenibacillus sp. 481]|uniref:calcium-translocating P-type ATPase, SERCA-type n=1 Tax=Paenibacillus sp. 481 TaxID=2835869 RepID=UPI001E5639CC|nr:calcium-translocating P-type ATPase, SERCA-type [Paenibacillus sp. 481]UHA74566.1 calcium-translocating P-type ATPase, SERCA-type [Paenibacillus sp. 481]